MRLPIRFLSLLVFLEAIPFSHIRVAAILRIAGIPNETQLPQEKQETADLLRKQIPFFVPSRASRSYSDLIQPDDRGP
ncbi:hypothetical protein Pr1d_14570 [Bythopirellula goksoeyrii]|uniref:Uncharacterized protein n=1 Tax=Bythopirellula goksoeyrii TaxID=1400387 RepID=A0A5B9Q566_9BACT|nr:hypothetical protein Pr1d_14570 [Bythopirellula goksoeyrii]